MEEVVSSNLTRSTRRLYANDGLGSRLWLYANNGGNPDPRLI